MELISWNVNGIRSCYKKGSLDWLKNESPDIACIQETKAQQGQLDEGLVNFGGYTSYWNDSPKKGYAGVSVYTRKKPSGVEKGFPAKSFDEENRTLVLKFREFTLINVYFPNGGMGPERLSYKLEFYDKFLSYLKGLKEKNIVLCGDVNTAHKEIDLARPKENELFSGFLPEERAWIDKLINAGFIDTFRQFNSDDGNYTWWDYKTRSRERNVGWRIDYFFISENLKKKLKNAFILKDITGSDHCPVGIELDVKS